MSAQPIPEQQAKADRIAEALADRVAEILLPQLLAALNEPVPTTADTPRLVDATELADILGVARSYVYEHADRLGAVRLGDGPKARLRFDVDTARAAMTGTDAPSNSPGSAPRQRRRNAALPQPGSILTSKPTITRRTA